MTGLPQDVVADLRQENARLLAELRAARDRQACSAEILSTIAGAPGDAERALQKVAETTARLFGASSVTIRIARGDEWGQSINVGAGSERIAAEVSAARLRLGARNLPSTVLGENRQVHIRDLDNPDPAIADWPGIPPARAAGTRAMAGTPLRREGKAIGVLIVHRDRPEPFTAEELALQQGFADQAVIAIENARLFNETKEALERQTATADILKVIAGSPSDVQPVFEAIAASAKRLIGGFTATVMLFIGDALHLVALTPTNAAADEAMKASFPRPLSEFPPFALVRGGETVQFADTEAENVPPLNRQLARLRGYRSMVFTPLMNSGAPIGILSVTRIQTGTFPAHHVQLLETFADQAVIAIENARLFDEVQAKTRDLSEALQQQTATADVLKVISRSAFDLETVMNTLARSASELCAADLSALFLRDGNFLTLRGISDIFDVKMADFLRQTRVEIDDQSYMGRSVLSGTVANIPDFASDTTSRVRTFQQAIGFRAILIVPLMREGRGVGVFALCRNHVGAFSQRQIDLIQTFADQAVIAIENVRLFDEVQARTRDLTESLQQQTATADVLKVISRSAFDLQTVLDTLVASASTLCSADQGMLLLLEGGVLKPLSYFGPHSDKFEFRKSLAAAPHRGTMSGRAVLDGQTAHVPDVLIDPEFSNNSWQELTGFRAMLAVPLMRQAQPIGAMALSRTTPGPFTDRQIELVTTFADQAVIAIENVRLFDEVQARTKELAASLDDLRTAQDRLVQTEKLASLGQLTAGIAHEIKNPLNFVNNFSALSAELTDELNEALKSATLSDKIREEVDELTGLLKDNLDKVVQHGKRADSIVKNMLLHSREGTGEHRPADINALLDESLNLAYHGARAEKPQFNVTLQRNFDEMAGMIELFPQEITRVFLNLISNGFYAVTKRKTEIGNSGFEPVVSATTRNLGDRVEIRIRDNGTGIPADVKEKMFNPFFTTKPAGEGTGLGLSMSHDIIVKQHGGRIEVETEPGDFTEFTIVLPRTSNFSNKIRGQT
ncbi:GAF domain-containing protein [Bradyrhizobium sp. AZCC 2289]|uniref:GAF domain-containing protein n=1 Tax=Bradyrhizobium sp. AZCC 2289 TaxID=3117026 RepID=UPI002FF3EC92